MLDGAFALKAELGKLTPAGRGTLVSVLQTLKGLGMSKLLLPAQGMTDCGADAAAIASVGIEVVRTTGWLRDAHFLVVCTQDFGTGGQEASVMAADGKAVVLIRPDGQRAYIEAKEKGT